MATSTGFHGSEPMPHLYPPPRPVNRGADLLPKTYVFQPITANATLFNYRKDDLEISQLLEDEDSLPTEQISLFTNWISTARPELCAPDPDLGLTPEKRVPSQRSNLRTNGNFSPDTTKGKAGLKVRFDVESSSESEIEKSPEKKSSNSVELVDIGDVEVQNLIGQMKIQKHYDTKVCNEKMDHDDEVTEQTKVYPYSVQPNALKHSKTLENSQVDDIEMILTSENRCTDVRSKMKQRQGAIPKSSMKGNNCSNEDCESSNIDSGYFKQVVITREREERPVVSEYSFPFTKDSESVEETGILVGSAFERPEYNSTLRVGKELKGLKANRPNVAKALKKKLESSETIRTEINEKAASKVNRRQEVFKGLVSLEVPVNDIVTQVERDQVAKVKSVGSKQKKTTKSKDWTGKEPDIMDLFTPDLQRETADFSLSGMSIPKDTLSIAAHERAFDLYRHNRAWEGLD